MSSVVSGVKKGISAIGGAVKSIVKGIGTVFKKVWESKVGRIALVAAAIYVSYGALTAPGGFLGASSAAVPGAVAPTTTAAAGGTVAAGTGAAAPAAELAWQPYVGAEAMKGAGAGVVDSVVGGGGGFAGGIAGAAPAAAPTASAVTPTTIATPAIETKELTGAAKIFKSITDMASGVGNAVKNVAVGSPNATGEAIDAGMGGSTGGLLGYLEAHPGVALAGMAGLSSALQKSPEEIQKDQERRYNTRLAQTGSVDVGSVPRRPLTRMDGTPVYNSNGGLNGRGA